MADHQAQLSETVTQAYRDGRPLRIKARNSKSFLCLGSDAQELSTLEHSGVVSYEPSELVVTVRSGTGIGELQDVLAEQQQTLAFDPPCFDGNGTIGGAIATGLSGPARPWSGAARDFVLGSRILNGKGEVLKFGGQVMKNVAGYDVSRLMTGAFGTLGVILDISVKVLPLPERTLTLAREMTAEDAIGQMNRFSGQSLPISGACWYDNMHYLRVSGTEAGVAAAQSTIGGEVYDDPDFWRTLRDQSHVFFSNSFWRISVPSATPMLSLTGQWLIDWGGAQRWLQSDELPENIIQACRQAGGHAQQWKHPGQQYLRTALDPIINKYHQRLKETFDPDRILNRGVMYPDL